MIVAMAITCMALAGMMYAFLKGRNHGYLVGYGDAVSDTRKVVHDEIAKYRTQKEK